MTTNQKIIYKTYQHNPPHLFIPNAKYFITASTYQKLHHFSTKFAKQILLESIIKGFSKGDWHLEDWVILDNHYHLIVNSPENAVDLPKIIRDIHRFTTLKLRKTFPDLEQKKRIWYNYWDTCLTYERSYFARINYTWFNPVKHFLINDPVKWEFGSYYYRFRENEDAVRELVRNYPFDKIKVEDDF